MLPAPYTYTATDRGSHRFTVTLETVGTETVTVTWQQHSTTHSTDTFSVSAAAEVAGAGLSAGEMGAGAGGGSPTPAPAVVQSETIDARGVSLRGSSIAQFGSGSSRAITTVPADAIDAAERSDTGTTWWNTGVKPSLNAQRLDSVFAESERWLTGFLVGGE